MAEVDRTTLKAYFENGKVPTEDAYIDLIDSTGYLPYACKRDRSTTQSIPNATWTEVAWDHTNLISHPAFLNGSYPARIYAPVTAYYTVHVQIGFASLSNDILLGISLKKNGATAGYTLGYSHSGNNSYLRMDILVYATADQYYTVDIYQAAGSAQSLLASANVHNYFSLNRV